MEILLIDNQPNIVRKLRSQLKSSGYEISAVFDGEDRLGYLGYIAKNIPSVILLSVTNDVRFDITAEALADIRSISKDSAIVLLIDRYDVALKQLALEHDAVWVLNSETELSLLPVVLKKIDKRTQSKMENDRENLYHLFSEYMRQERPLSYQQQQFLFDNYEGQAFFRVAVIRVLPPYRKHMHLDETSLVFLKGFEILLKRLQTFPRYSVRRYREDVIVCFMGNAEAMDMVEPVLAGFLKDMAQFSQSVSHCVAWAFLGQCVDSIRSVPESYQNARGVMDERFIGSPFTIIKKENAVTDAAQSVEQYQIFDIKKSLVNALITYEEMTIRKTLIQLKSNIVSTVDFHGANIKYIYKTLCLSLFHELERNEVPVKELNPDGTIEEFEYFWNIDNVFERLESLYCEGSKMLREQEENSLPASVILAKRYVRSNFNMPLTLKDVSDYVGMNKNYFSNYFKKCTSQSFKEYQRNLRVRYAKQMLLDNKYTIDDISEAVGYVDVKYFSRVFKQVTGIAPGEYRKKYHVVSD